MSRGAAIALARARARAGTESRTAADPCQRFELKFRLPIALRSELRRELSAHVQPDPYTLERPGHSYTVRSIYFDSEQLEFYHDKLDSVRIRKKLRVRGYDRPEDCAVVFFEIKRKRGKRSHKERLCVPAAQLVPALSGGAGFGEALPFGERRVIQRFRFHVEKKHLRPVVLVSYEREPMIGIDDPSLRVTFDSNLRSFIDPRLDQLFAERILRPFEDRHFILELKFNARMPRWMASLMRDFDLRYESYSKYCHGIDAWRPHPK